MNDIELAIHDIESLEVSLSKAKERLEKAQKPKIKLEHMGVYERSDGSVVFVQNRIEDHVWVRLLSFTKTGGWGYNEDGTAVYSNTPDIVKHVGKIGVVPVGYDFQSIHALTQDPLTFNTK